SSASSRRRSWRLRLLVVSSSAMSRTEKIAFTRLRYNLFLEYRHPQEREVVDVFVRPVSALDARDVVCMKPERLGHLSCCVPEALAEGYEIGQGAHASASRAASDRNVEPFSSTLSTSTYSPLSMS